MKRLTFRFHETSSSLDLYGFVTTSLSVLLSTVTRQSSVRTRHRESPLAAHTDGARH